MTKANVNVCLNFEGEAGILDLETEAHRIVTQALRDYITSRKLQAQLWNGWQRKNNLELVDAKVVQVDSEERTLQEAR